MQGLVLFPDVLTQPWSLIQMETLPLNAMGFGSDYLTFYWVAGPIFAVHMMDRLSSLPLQQLHGPFHPTGQI